MLAVIPARGGSKGIPRKNLRLCAGKPLLAWSIEAALEARQVDRVVVSSDDDEILRVAEQHGAEPLLRPSVLASDTAMTAPVIYHALTTVAPNLRPWVKSSDYHPYGVVVLQPTVPVRPVGLVDDCIGRLIDVGADSLVTAHPLHFVWQRVYRIAPRSAGQPPERWAMQTPQRSRRQDMSSEERRWAENGSVFAVTMEYLLRTGEHVGGVVEVLETPWTVDIDTEEDFALAEMMLLARGQRQEVA